MSHVFISYHNLDGDFIYGVLDSKVREAGFTTWIYEDRLRAGLDWRKEIDQAIRDSFAMVVVMTPEAKASEYVTYEWAFSLGVGVGVIPILLRPTELHPRLEALQHLNFTNPKARRWDKLIEALREEAKEHAPTAVHVPHDAPPVVKHAVAKFDSPDPAERKAAIESLAQTDHLAAHEALAGAVQHPVWDVRVNAAFALAQFDDVRAVPGLLDALCDEDRYVRYTAARALGQIGDPVTVPGLLDALRDEDRYVRYAAAEALERIGTPEALAAAGEWRLGQS